MGVADPGNVLCTGTVLHCQDKLIDQLTSILGRGKEREGEGGGGRGREREGEGGGGKGREGEGKGREGREGEGGGGKGKRGEGRGGRGREREERGGKGREGKGIGEGRGGEGRGEGNIIQFILIPTSPTPYPALPLPLTVPMM